MWRCKPTIPHSESEDEKMGGGKVILRCIGRLVWLLKSFLQEKMIKWRFEWGFYICGWLIVAALFHTYPVSCNTAPVGMNSSRNACDSWMSLPLASAASQDCGDGRELQPCSYHLAHECSSCIRTASLSINTWWTHLLSLLEQGQLWPSLSTNCT